jgi:hypothetical protein
MACSLGILTDFYTIASNHHATLNSKDELLGVRKIVMNDFNGFRTSIRLEMAT